METALSAADYKQQLDEKLRTFDARAFIAADPLSIVYEAAERADGVADIELAALMTSIMAWGNRKMIQRDAKRLLEHCGNHPYRWLVDGKYDDETSDKMCVHRILNYGMLKDVLNRLQTAYREYGSIGQMATEKKMSVKDLLCYLSDATAAAKMGHPLRGSACKRLNMFLRWMIRKTGDVDLGLWRSEKMTPANLYAVMDTHVAQQANKMHLITYPKESWRAVEELTSVYRQWDMDDPLKYDMVIMALNIEEKHNGYKD